MIFTLQKGLFRAPKGFLLACERVRFALRKGSFRKNRMFLRVFHPIFASSFFYFAIFICQNFLLFKTYKYTFRTNMQTFPNAISPERNLTAKAQVKSCRAYSKSLEYAAHRGRVPTAHVFAKPIASREAAQLWVVNHGGNMFHETGLI